MPGHIPPSNKAVTNGHTPLLDGLESAKPGASPTRPLRYAVQFPRTDLRLLAQSEAYFYLEEEGERQRIRFHDYPEIYGRPGLYEQLFYGRLKCTSPDRMAEWLHKAVSDSGESLQSYRVLDLGAGNGMLGESLLRYGFSRIIGIDILKEAKEATERDRPGVYDAYYVADMCAPGERLQNELQDWQFDCFTTVAALGFGDIPPEAFINCYRFVRPHGWVAFNIKESFLSESDESGFSRLIRKLWQSGELEIHRMIRYRHRYSIDGDPLYYYGIVGRKLGEVR